MHFDPTSLFITATNYKDALNNLADAETDICDGCFTKAIRSDKDCVDECRRRLVTGKIIGNDSTRRRFWDAFLQLALPTFDFKRMAQFDFVKNGGILIPAPFPESALNNYTFTWDLRHLIAPTKEHLATEDVIGAYDMPKPQGAKFCSMVSATGQETYISVADSFKITNCRDLADSLNAASYKLGCLAERPNNSSGANQETDSGEGKKHFEMARPNEATPRGETAAPSPKDDNCRWGS